MEIRINRDGTEFGPYTLEQVNQLLAEGSLLPTDLAWYDPMETWAVLSQVATNLNQAAAAASRDRSCLPAVNPPGKEKEVGSRPDCP